VSGLSVVDFMKFISIQTVSAEALQQVGLFAERLAALGRIGSPQTSITLRLKG